MSQRHTATGRQIASGRNQAGERQAKSADREAIDTAEFGALRRVDWDHFEQYSHPQYFQNDVLHTDSGQTTLVTSTGDPVGSGANPWTGSQLSKQTTDADRPIYQGRDTGIAGDGYLDAMNWSKPSDAGFSAFILLRNDNSTSNALNVLRIDNPNSNIAVSIRCQTDGSCDRRTEDDDGTEMAGGPHVVINDDSGSAADFSDNFHVLTYTTELVDGDLVERTRFDTDSEDNQRSIASSPGNAHGQATLRANINGERPMEGPIMAVGMVNQVFPTAMETTIIQNLLAVR